ncbi:RipA family octameric membrane protein [Streptomyces albidoflavus]|uniref:RipA family octameric membrane protein n=1 Tax=Streptomyces albidoflavus TaxID=1886 RepID=UPI003F4D6819
MSRELHDAVWNDTLVRQGGSENVNLQSQLILEQYKLCVEMADRVSARRGLTNSFFLTLNLAAVSVIASVVSKLSSESGVFIPIVTLIIMCGECFVWFCTLRSYRLLNRAKYAVVEVLEERLPARAYSKGEWHAFVRSGKHGIYVRLTTAEQIMPLLFSLGYVALFGYFIGMWGIS